MTYLAGFVVSMLLTMVLTPIVRSLGYRFNMIDIPDSRKVHADPVPRIGGIAIVLGAITPLLIWLPVSDTLLGYMVGAFIIIFFGVLDDRFELNYKIKFLAQIAATAWVILVGGVLLKEFSFMQYHWVLPGWLSYSVTGLFILTVINAINFADGLDGLAGGVVLLSLSAVMLLGSRIGAPDIVLVCAALVGSLLGFLLFNSHPAQIFMGDGGSQFLGYSLAVLSIYLIDTAGQHLSSFFPLLLVGLPLIDLMVVIGTRLIKKQSIFLPDNSHIHHRLLSLGLRQYGSVFVIYLLHGTIVGSALLFRNQGATVHLLTFIWFIFVICTALVAVWAYKGIPGADLINRLVHGPFRRVNTVILELDLARWARLLALGLILGYLFVGVLIISNVHKHVGILSTILFAALILVQPRGLTEKISGWFVRFIYYLSASGILYLLYDTPGVLDNFKLALDMYFIVLALLIFIGIEYSKDQRLSARPIDLLVVVTALILPAISGDTSSYQLYWIVGVHLMVIFYGLELVLLSYRGSQKLNIIQYLYAAPLIVLAVRGVISL
ncbi:MAG TPA: undecaprenyl/decaprenyl-phosphate alpha-N-acetylglucosaminyl 1-phosphate transferase [Gammaproteobacteria bacterium]|nr:undecaprenyl/decaprenyl-phosphate alpha-N-acetylglucosaminyl 1-phosphate transferase [Gammaproteobacteria bacterium]